MLLPKRLLKNQPVHWPYEKVKPMVIVEASQIPDVDQIVDAPISEPIKILRACQELQILCEKERGIGISAVQAGIPWKLFLVKGDGSCPFIPSGEYGYFVNCRYEPVTEERVVSLEGCLSIRSPDGRLRSFHVERYQQIKLLGHRLTVGKTLFFQELAIDIGLTEQGVVFQHEIDHQLGQAGLITNKGKEVFVW